MKKQVLFSLIVVSFATMNASRGGNVPPVATTGVKRAPDTRGSSVVNPPAASIPATAAGLKAALANGRADDADVAAGLADGLADQAVGHTPGSPAYNAAYQFASGRAPQGNAKASNKLGRMGK